MYVNKWIVTAATLALLLLTASVAYLAGERAGRVAVPADAKLVERKPDRRSPVRAAAPTRSAEKMPKPAAPVPALSVNAVKEADYKRLGMGCMCAFSSGGSEYLIGGGDADALVLRADGRARLIPIGEEGLQTLFDDRFSYRAGGYAVAVKPVGKLRPGCDGHSVPAELEVSSEHAEKRLRGTWTCGC